jgi:hypothetical protein
MRHDGLALIRSIGIGAQHVECHDGALASQRAGRNRDTPAVHDGRGRAAAVAQRAQRASHVRRQAHCVRICRRRAAQLLQTRKAWRGGASARMRVRLHGALAAHLSARRRRR